MRAIKGYLQHLEKLDVILNRKTAALIHFLLSTSFFAPFLFRNHILIGSTDLLDVNYPLLLEAKRQFLSMTFPLWNPYLFAGMPASLSACSYLFCPENWPLFVLSESSFFHFVTLFALLKLSLLGFTSFLLFCEETNSPRWALLASLTYQLCGLTMWAITADALSVLLYLTIALYLGWSLAKRPQVRSYVFLTATLTCLMLCGNLIYQLYALFAFMMLTAMRLYFHKASPKHIKVVVASVGTAVLITAFRWLPTIAELSASSRLSRAEHLTWFQELPFLVLRLFDPELFGISYSTSFQLIKALSNSVKGANVHIYSYMPHYFGVLPVLLVLWAAFSRPKGRAFSFWIFYIASLMALYLGLEPITTLLRVTVQPLFHRTALQILLPVGFSMALAHAGLHFEAAARDNTIKNMRLSPLAIAIVVIALYIVAVWLILLQYIANVSLIAKTLAVLSIILFIWHKKTKFAQSPIIAFLAATLSIAFLCSLASIRRDFFITSEFNILGSSIVLLGAILLLQIAQAKIRHSRWLIGPLLVIVLLNVFLLWFPFLRSELAFPSMYDVLSISLIGLFRFLFVSAAFLLILANIRKGTFKTSLFYPLCISLSLADQLAAFKVQGDTVLNPFAATKNPYVTQSSPLFSHMDLENYRINLPNTFAGIPLHRIIYSRTEPLSSAFMLQSIRSYGGYLNAMPESYHAFIRSMSPQQSSLSLVHNGFPANLTDNRLLDLLGVRYDYLPSTNQLFERPQALSRFMLFHSYKLISPEKSQILKALQDSSFNPKKTILLETFPGFPNPGEDTLALKLDASVIRPHHIALQLRATNPGILFFGDSYHPDWKAYLGTVPAPIFRVDGNFMGVAVPSGQSFVELRFEPRSLNLALWLSAIGTLVFLLFSFLLTSAKPKISIPSV